MSSSAPSPGDLVADKYRIDELIGEGGMGSVFAATHTVTGKRVALKWLKPGLATDATVARRFVREARIAAQLEHPNVVNVFDVGSEDGQMFLVMELLRGEPLSSRMGAPVPPETLIELLMPALRAVAAAHARGIVHRDLKPDNIFLCEGSDGTPREAKVLDFGISKVTRDGDANLSLTQTGAVMGTPYYMSPEQVRGERDIDTRTDVYALGVILYEGLTGRMPFTADVYSALVVKIATETPTPIRDLAPGVPVELEATVERAMARRREDRFQDVEELALALEAFGPTAFRPGTTGSATATGHELHRVERMSTTPMAGETVSLPVERSGRVVAIVAAVGLVALIVGAAWLAWSPGEPEVAPAAPGLTPPAPTAPATAPIEQAESPETVEPAAARPTPPATARPRPEPERPPADRDDGRRAEREPTEERPRRRSPEPAPWPETLRPARPVAREPVGTEPVGTEPVGMAPVVTEPPPGPAPTQPPAPPAMDSPRRGIDLRVDDF